MCFDRLIQDLICLEKDGIEVFKPRNKTVYAGLAYIIGDNLGQHLIAEMNQCFSAGNICRWCKITYQDVCR